MCPHIRLLRVNSSLNRRRFCVVLSFCLGAINIIKRQSMEVLYVVVSNSVADGKREPSQREKRARESSLGYL
jgi:hypothetical protein